LEIKSRSKAFEVSVIYSAFFLRGFSFVLLAPIFTRLIDSNIWGGILAAQALAGWLYLLLDYGFSLSASREIAGLNDKDSVSKYFRDVISAKLILVMPAIIITMIFAHFGVLSNYQQFAWGALILGIVQGLSPMWYYQAVDNLFVYSLIDMLARIIYIVLSILFIKANQDAFLIIVFQILGLLITTLVTLFLIFRDLGPIRWSLLGGLRALSNGFRLSTYTLITGVYGSISVLILGFSASPHVVAVYGNADRIVRAGLSLMGPINQLTLPLSARKYAVSLEEGLAFTRKMLTNYGLGGFLFGASLFIFSEKIVLIMFGDVYTESASIIKLLSLLFPLISVNTVLTYHFMIPNHLDGTITKVYLFSSALSVITMVLIVKTYGSYGMGVSVLVPELFSLSVLSYVILKLLSNRRKNADLR